MEKLTDQDLMMLELLTYLNGSVFEAAGHTKPEREPKTVEDLLRIFDEKALKRLEECDDKDISAFMTGKEWAATIREMQDNESLRDLSIVNRNPNVHANCYKDPFGNVYVAFKGTTGGTEWYDNVLGLYQSDTLSQKEALDYIEGLPYDDITVVGHSKGGNKAQYVTITSDKVTRCVSMDGQGFSQEFLDKYANEIEAKGGLVKNYSLENDYVHILLFRMPGSEQIFCQNGENNPGLRNHSPGAYYKYEKDKDGKWRIAVYADGKMIKKVPENKGMTNLHEFTCFVLNVMQNKDREKVAEYLGIALALAMCSEKENYKVEVEGVTYTKKDLAKFLMSDQETMALVLAYVMKYADTCGMSDDEMMALLDAFGLGDILRKLAAAYAALVVTKPDLAIAAGFTGVTISELLEFLHKQITDGKNDPLVQKLIEWLGAFINKEAGTEIDWVKAWKDIEAEYIEIGKVSKYKAAKDSKIPKSRVWDYSENAYHTIIETISTAERLTDGSITGWNRYAGEEWYDSLFISLMINGVKKYYEHLSEINGQCKRQTDRIFERVRNVDFVQAGRIRDMITEISEYSTKIRMLKDYLG